MTKHAIAPRSAAALAGALMIMTALACEDGSSVAAAPARDDSPPTSIPKLPGPISDPSTFLAGCPVFPRNNYWNAPITQLAVNSHSNAWMSNVSPGSNLHPDFGANLGGYPYGIPFTLVDDTHPKVEVTFQYWDESDRVPYPLGADTEIEGGKDSNGDRHALVLDTSTCELYETYDTHERSTGWWAGSGATWNLRSNHLRPDGWTSADAAGLAILPGLLRYNEVEQAGNVTHAIRFTADEIQSSHIWPARHDAGGTNSPDYPPMGARFRLKANFPLTGYRDDTLAVLRAMKTYGLVLADRGTSWYFQGAADRRWPEGLLDELKSIPQSAFEAVDTAPMMVRPNSGAAR